VPRRVRRPKDKEQLLSLLTDREKLGPFGSYKDALVFAAALGYANRKSVPFEQSSEPIDWGVFNGFGDEALVNMLPIAEERRLELLAPEQFDDRLTRFEQYANGGLAMIQQKLAGSTAEPLDVVLELIQSLRNKRGEDEPMDWDSIAKQIR
jgi:dnd system-associated protein 4